MGSAEPRLRLHVANGILRVLPEYLPDLPAQLEHIGSVQIVKAHEAEIIAPHPQPATTSICPT